MSTPAGAAIASLMRSPWQATVGVLVCLAIPLASWVFGGRGRFAFTMYSSTVTYRLEIAWLDARGTRHALALTDVAREVSFDSAAPFLAGADVYRTVPQIDALRDHLRDVARAACGTGHGPTIEIALYERALPLTSDAPDVASATAQTTERVSCPRPE
jgi:hypothetical protein